MRFTIEYLESDVRCTPAQRINVEMIDAPSSYPGGYGEIKRKNITGDPSTSPLRRTPRERLLDSLYNFCLSSGLSKIRQLQLSFWLSLRLSSKHYPTKPIFSPSISNHSCHAEATFHAYLWSLTFTPPLTRRPHQRLRAIRV